MGASSDRLELMVADLHPTDETDPAKAELVANLKLELASLRSGIRRTQTGAWRVGRPARRYRSDGERIASQARRSLLPTRRKLTVADDPYWPWRAG
jgi:hypothetical protein